MEHKRAMDSLDRWRDCDTVMELGFFVCIPRYLFTYFEFCFAVTVTESWKSCCSYLFPIPNPTPFGLGGVE